MKKTITNEERYNNYKKRKFLRIGMILTSLLTIIFAVLTLSINLGIGYALVSYLISIVLRRMYAKTIPVIEEEKKKVKPKKKKTSNKNKK